MTHEVRKTVTTLFCDVVASSTLGELLDAEAVRRMIGRFFAEMGSVVEQHGGTVEKFIGDEVMAVFGIPAVHEDDALRAARAATAMRERLVDLNRELEARWGARLDIRIGVNTGEVVAGDPSAGHGFMTGDAVVVAKRLQTAAGAGEILLGEATYGLVRHAVEATPVGPLTVKGQRHLAAYRLDHVLADAPVLARTLDIPFVGRARELNQLRGAYDVAVRERAAQLVSVLGPAGIGKSRLVHELVAAVEGEATALVGRCLAYGEGVTFWPVREILRQAGEGEGALSGTSDEIFRRTRLVLERLARERPVIVCLEDVHWAEPTLVDLIEYLAGWTRDAPVLLVCLARPEFLEARPEWLSPRPNATTITLIPLAPAEADALLDVLAAPPAAREAIARAAEGNPLFVEQMAAMAAETGAAAIEVPPSIRALLAGRLDRLPAAERGVAERAAVLGREFSVAGVSELASAELGADVRAHLLALARKDLVEPDPASEDGFRFRHALIRDAAYDAISKQRRAELHERAGDWLAAAGGDDVIVGLHLEQAYRYRAQLGRIDDTGRALAARAADLLSRAGRRAAARGDVPAAESLLERAVSLFPGDATQRPALQAELGSTLMRAGEFARAAEALTAAAAGAREAADRRIELRVEIELQTLRSFTSPAGAAEDDARVAAHVIPELERLGDDVGLAKAWRLASDVHAIACRWQARAEALERALQHARRVPEARHEASAIVALLAQALHYGPTPVPEAIDRCRALLAAAEGDPALRAGLRSTLAGLVAARGDIDEARALYRESVALYEELGLRFRRAARTLVGAEVEVLAGDLAAAERELRIGYETLDAMGESGVRAVVAAYLADVLCTRGDSAEAERLAGIAADAAERDDLAAHVAQRAVVARVCARRAEFDRAEALAREATSLAAPTDFLTLQAGAWAALGEVLTLAGAEEEAVEAFASARDLYQRKGNVAAARRLSVPEVPIRDSTA